LLLVRRAHLLTGATVVSYLVGVRRGEERLLGGLGLVQSCQVVQQLAGRLRDPTVDQGGRGNHQHVARLEHDLGERLIQLNRCAAGHDAFGEEDLERPHLEVPS
jgi:hypothetical protein